MNSSQSKYVPVLKWQQGEYQALFWLNENVKTIVFPLLNVPPIGYDFEEEKLKNTAHEQVEKFPRRFKDKWDGKGAFVDFHESLHDEFMNNGTSIVTYVFDELKLLGQFPIPVTGISRSKNYQTVVQAASKSIGTGFALRIKLEDLMNTKISNHITELIKQNSYNYSDIDLIIDLGAPPSFRPYDIFAKALSKRISQIVGIELFRSFIVVSTSINLRNVKSPGAILTRHEWNFYKVLIDELNEVRLPVYGDYCIESPEYITLDMRLINPAGKLIYTTKDSWHIQKGKAFRGNERQMIKHCKTIIAAEYYKGEKYSWGDNEINKMANELRVNCGNLGTWKKVGFNHHITLVAEQLSIFHGS